MVKDKKYYNILNIDINSSQSEIKKAYRKQALQWHPDKNQHQKELAEEKFKEISESYQILSNPEKRKLYDQFGEDGMKEMNTGGNFTNPFDMFSNLFSESGFGGSGSGFGGFGGESDFNPFGSFRNSRRSEKKGEIIKVVIEYTLEETYNGSKKKIDYNKNILCKKCDGTGSKNKKKDKCSDCNGKGMKITMRRIGPGMVQQMQQSCNSCNGSGRTVNKSKRCNTCVNGVVNISVTDYINIPISVENKSHIIKENIGNEIDNGIKGDIAFIFIEKEHKLFKRYGLNLLCNFEINIGEALLGFSREIINLDNKKIIIGNYDITDNNKNYILRGQGLRNNYKVGDIIVKVNYNFNGIKEKIPLLKNVFGNTIDINDNDQYYNIEEYINDNYNNNMETEDEPDQGNVQCATQ